MVLVGAVSAAPAQAQLLEQGDRPGVPRAVAGGCQQRPIAADAVGLVDTIACTAMDFVTTANLPTSPVRELTYAETAEFNVALHRSLKAGHRTVTVSVPGDTLRIADYTLYRNGEPITGSPAFDKNARRADRYVGYRPEGLFKDGAEVVIAPGQYLPLGDNSANSLDGRYWGTVAAADVVGRPLFIYYPFTNRWGVAP
jgi:signal peptidase I